MMLTSLSSLSQIERVEPPCWWVGFVETDLQLLVKEENISTAIPEINYSGVSIEKIEKGASPNYLFIDLNVDIETKPGTFEIIFTYKNGKKKRHIYELKKRKKESKKFIGFDSSDAIYLITPDRFANGDASNDIKSGLKETSINRNKDYSRHGGDIKGIIDNLSYIDEMGFTAIWSCPLLTNDMKQDSYHGYAITDFYQVDPRYGTLGEYIKLSKMAEEMGIKLIMDQVVNHCGIEHWWMKDLPFKDWINFQLEFEQNDEIPISNHRRTINQDLYSSESDSKLFHDGWFSESMPDLNQRNSFMAKYLIQNSIWWIEIIGLGGIRQDTYPYSDKEFMSQWAGSIIKEYPNFSIVGEEWSFNPLLVGYWQQGIKNNDGYQSNLTSTMDFPMQKLIVEALKEEDTWCTGFVKIYEGLANDFYYHNPSDILLFPDNHDMDRIYTQLDKDLVLTKMALSYILILPRIPQIYYGTEILMDNSDKFGDHGRIRSDFPGGWEGDKVNGFTGKGLTSEQVEMQSFLRILLQYRKNSDAIHKGKTVHFTPENGVYSLFRLKGDEVVILFVNKNKSRIIVDLNKFEELQLKDRRIKNVITGDEFIWQDTLTFETKGSIILTTKM